MFTPFACALALISTQGPTTDVAHVQVQYRVKMAGIHGLVATPLVRTINGSTALVELQMADRRTGYLSITPRVWPDGKLDTAINVTVKKANGELTSFAGQNGPKAFLDLRESGRGPHIDISMPTKAPKLRGKDLGISISGSVVNDEDDQFAPPKTRGDAPVASVIYSLELSDAKAVFAKPVVRTLMAQPFTVTQSCKDASFTIEGMPRLDQKGNLMTFMRVDLPNDDPITFVTTPSSPNPFRFAIVHTDFGLTTKFVPVTGRRRPRLNP